MAAGKIQIIVGGQYGSEGKGTIAAYLVLKEKIDYAVRTGATNAGHTVPYNGVRYAMQQLPVGWIRPETKLILGAGALIDLDILKREVELITMATGTDVRKRIYVDYRAYVHRADAAARSKASGRHHAIGATGKGCSEALMDRIRLRGVENLTIDAYISHHDDLGIELRVCDTEKMLNYAYDGGASIQLEGTQGTGLDLYLGPYPYTTHKQTTAAQWLSECGLSPALPTDIVMVVRTLPIRVAGNSGPLPEETSWPSVARSINQRRHEFDLSPIVAESAIVTFENAVRLAAAKYSIPVQSTGLDQHIWLDADRERFREGLSEIHKTALSTLSPDVLAELTKLFEMTTVTKKLRRIAHLSQVDLITYARQVRPHRIAVTFMNYLTPERWCVSDPVTDAEIDWLIAMVETPCKAPVVMINRGPELAHVIETGRT